MNEISNLDKVDIEIIYCLYRNEKNNSLKSFKISQIIEETNLKLTYYTYLNRINKLIKLGLVKEGIKDIKAKTFYITKDGSEYLVNNILSNMDI